MAGTRLWISTIILAELIILAILSMYYGLCVQNDDLLCHALDDDDDHDIPNTTLRPLTRPSWWSTTLHIHLIVEEEEESSSLLYQWSQLLEDWMKTSPLKDMPYFGQTQIHMNVVVPSKSSNNDRFWERTQNVTNTIVQKSSIWIHLPDRPSNTDGSSSDKDLDWMIYVPTATKKEDSQDHQLTKADSQKEASSSSWVAWKRGSMQLVTVVSTGGATVVEPTDMNTLLTSWIQPWLETTITVGDDEDGKMSENDYLRKLQFTWQKTIMNDFDDWKRYLSPIQQREILGSLGASPSQSLSHRLESLLQARAILEGVVMEVTTKNTNKKKKDTLTPEFPLEHYAAVFLPLLFPLLMPFLTSFVKELKRFKEKVKKKKKHERSNKAPRKSSSSSPPSAKDAATDDDAMVSKED